MTRPARAISTGIVPQWRGREYNPVAAAYAVAQFLPADPVLWLDRCGLAGITVFVDNGRLFEIYMNGDVRADPSQVTFLASWLNLTPGGKEAVIAYLTAKAVRS
jgi:hypothetical protein